MATDYFLKLEGDAFKGESKQQGHVDEIDVLSWSWGESNAGSAASGGGQGSGKVNMQDFSFAMKICKASPKLLLACATGEHISKATLVCRRAGKTPQEYLKITLSECLVSSFQTGGSSGDEIPTDSVSINFAKIEYSYSPQKADGSLGTAIPVGYDMTTSKDS